MLGDQARVSLVAQPTEAAVCELCTAEGIISKAAMVVWHQRGGALQLAVCDWCVQALRRLAAATGGHAAFALPEGGALAPPGRVVPSGARPASPPVLIHEFAQPVQDPGDGATYVARAYGQERVDGTWVGWIEFVGIDAKVALLTDQETTQSNREGVAYWASGLQPTYLEGAFARVRRERSTTRVA